MTKEAYSEPPGDQLATAVHRPGVTSAGLVLNKSPRPYLSVVRGDATAEEIAALTAVLATLGSRPGPDGGRGQRSRWSDPARMVRRPVGHAPDGWLASARRGLG